MSFLKYVKYGMIVALLFSVALLTTSLASSHALRSLSTHRFSEEWRMVLQFSGNSPLKYRYFTLSGPDRLVIDIDDTRSAVDLSNVSLQDSPLYRVRSSERLHGSLRLVLDMKSPLRTDVVKVEQGGQQQLIVKLRGASVAALSVSTVNNKPKTMVSSDAPKRSSDIIVVIDPGHGGKDPGATGVRGTHEKTVVLSISKKLYRLINQQPGFKAYLTRDTDVYLTLRQRLAIARQHKADMFVAIHADAFHNKAAKGASVYALSTKGATSEAARWLADRENQSELLGGVELSDKTHMLQSVLISLSQTATIRSSIEIGDVIIASLKTFAHLHDDDVDQAAFVVLKSPDIPSLLIETGFLSNPQEELRLRTQSYQNKVAQSIKHGIVSYFQVQPPRGSALALAQERRRNELWHKVSRGDSLSYIAFRYHVSAGAIRQANHLNSDVIHIGQELKIPQQRTG
ncbi:MAG: N-acetylmuramoyl-L-alanine amidase [Coxiellaceae bacterium]|nr:N-acetylmuramoyl-L-alanine amidase [Coxiellaceae bacterium]|tara:strand:+ start:6124 stop:7494 length:1371 start_codon:yes stop_codon:yes gene_type:complete